MKKHVFNTIIITLVMLFSLSGCAENHYYHQNHHHTMGYYHRHHQEPPPGIDIDIHK